MTRKRMLRTREDRAIDEIIKHCKKENHHHITDFFLFKKGKKGRKYFMKNIERGEKGISFKMLCTYKYYMANFSPFCLCETLHYIVTPYATLHDVTLHCKTLHYVVRRYTTL